MTQTAVAARLQIPVMALWSLSGNAAFPRPTANDDEVNCLWDSGAIASFAALWDSAKANGWSLPTSFLPTADFVALASTAAPGSREGYRRIADALREHNIRLALHGHRRQARRCR
jgi:hypothetical protein